MVEILSEYNYFPVIGVVAAGGILALVISLIVVARSEGTLDAETLGLSVIFCIVGAVSIAALVAATLFQAGVGKRPHEDRAEAFHHQYPDVSEIYFKGEKVSDIDRFISLSTGAVASEDSFYVVMEDGTEYSEVYVVTESSDREHIARTLSLAIPEEGALAETSYANWTKMTELSTGENLQELKDSGIAPAYGFDEELNLVNYHDTSQGADEHRGWAAAEGDTERTESTDNTQTTADDADAENSGAPKAFGALLTGLMWAGTVLGTVGVAGGLSVLAVKGSKKRTNKVRDKLRNK